MPIMKRQETTTDSRTYAPHSSAPCWTVPIVDGRLQLGTWQQIVPIDFDVRPRTRSSLIQLLGEGAGLVMKPDVS